MKGKIKKINHDRKFGHFAVEGENDVHFAPKSLAQPHMWDALKVGDIFEFEPTPFDSNGKRSTIPGTMRLPGEKPRPPQERSEYKSREPEEIGNAQFRNPYAFVRFFPPPLVGSSPLMGRCAPPTHDRYLGLSGKISCNLTCLTPLFVADGESVANDSEIPDHKFYSFFTLGGKKAIPAASLRGMISNVFEAVTPSCLRVFDAEKVLSYRMDSGNARYLVPARVVERPSDGKLALQLLQGAGDRTQKAAWVLVTEDGVYGRRRPAGVERLEHGKKYWAILEKMSHRRKFQYWNVLNINESREVLASKLAPNQKLVAGFFCRTNRNINRKHDERLFFDLSSSSNDPDNFDPESLPVLDVNEHISRYEKLIEDYQCNHREAWMAWKRQRGEEPIPARDQLEDIPEWSRFVDPDGDDRRLKPGDLVYAKVSGNRLDLIAPVSVPRVRNTSPLGELLPSGHLYPCSRFDELCPACRVFGWVKEKPREESSVEEEADGKNAPPDEETGNGLKRQEDRKSLPSAVKGRVRFSHAELVREGDGLVENEITLSILDVPRPTTGLFYYRRRGANSPGEDNDDTAWKRDVAERNGGAEDTVLAGRKFYWRHPDGNLNGGEFQQHPDKSGMRKRKNNRTLVGAVSTGAIFTFTIEFEKLAPLELGALLWSLELEEGMAHRLGLAKPYGFGTVLPTLEKVEVIDFEKRWNVQSEEDGFVEVTAHQIAELISGYKLAATECDPDSESFEEIEAVQDLTAMLSEPEEPRLPIHYPRKSPVRDPDGKNFEWFVGNKKKLQTLAPPAEKGKNRLDYFGKNR